ncbi:sugar ABC transporter permease [Streptomyces phaeochromogenes]|uniref:Xylose transport system permease protein XylH n=1 Tax=Streptomyces phaeochromogenes TaxID=1923 RepID=A0ABZ1HW42_STRPH|nr:sugar ABC transporter permease [Streptomyces phaeochromogenes]WRZ36577.1 sugar ABC transporter permease [Streptomyces phaeochromogenes]WSD22008.1 sugar ABC transporter permease [Streptomyces phaeochromogenes]WSJ11385.1 sugar ABC transporter permease [Streptomyces phaeochromogenes]
MLPVVGGIVVIWTIFQILNPTFLSSTNLVNLSFDMVPVGVLALGIVCVLLAGQIDLSVGSVSGVSAAITAVVMVKNEQPMWLAVLAAVAAGCLIGWLYGQVLNRFGVPSFVVTLGGLLAFLGVQLWLLRGQNAINLPYDSTLVKFAQLWFVPHWMAYALAVVAAGGFLATGWVRARTRRRAGLSSSSPQWLVMQSLLLLAGLLLVVYYLNRTRGVAWMFVFFVALVLVTHYVLSRTKFGRSIYAVGGNAEASRRAGINVRRVYTSAFVLCSGLAAVGGILAASRLAAANQSTGTGDVNLNAIAAAVIGGTSLFGGRGSAIAALLGVLVIQSISSGLTLLNLDSSYRFMITGAVLLIAVGLDSFARRSRQAHGRG